MKGVYKRIVVERREYLVTAWDEDDAHCAEPDDDGDYIEDVKVESVEFVHFAEPEEPDDMYEAKKKMEDDHEGRD